MFRRTVLFILIAAVPLSAAGKPHGAPLVRLADQTVELKAFWMPTPAQKCTNWAWAAVVEAMLRAQQVTIKQNAWVQKANYGEVCVEGAPTMEALARVIDGNYVLDDGSHVRLQSRYVSGAPSAPGDLIMPLRRGQPLLMFWKSRALVVHGVTYDEYIYPNGQRMFQIKQISLLDPLLSGKEREVLFVNGRDNPADVGGIFRVEVIPEKRQKW